MNKRLFRIIGGIIVLFVLALAVILIYDNDASKEENSPGLFSSYLDRGYYRIDPKTILPTLDSGNTNVFIPFHGNPDNIEEVAGMPVHWTQADFLKIASAVGQFAWDDPMDLNDWRVMSILFRGSCDDPMGFNFATITYFKTRATGYYTRLIEIDPNFGWVRWGDGETYSKSILHKWNSVDLVGAKITADDALQIASEDAKKRFQFKEYCNVYIAMPQDDEYQNWYLKFLGASDALAYTVNLETGKYTFQNLSK